MSGETLGKRIVSDPRFDACAASSRASAARCWPRSTPRRRPARLPLKTDDGVGELDRYEEVYRATGAARPILELAFQYLRRHVPQPVDPVLLHGDFRNGN